MKTSNNQFQEKNHVSIMEMDFSKMDNHQLQEARTLFSEMVEREEQSDEAWMGLARIHRLESNNDLARACLLRGLDDNPYNRTAIVTLYNWFQEDGVDFNRAVFDSYLDKHSEDKDVLKFKN